jgi:predicted transcriptional regulator
MTKKRDHSLELKNKDMKQVKVGIMPLKDFQAYTKAIVTGKHKRKRGEPKIWFSSMAALAQVLSDSNRELLSLIAEQKPESITELSKLSGRAQSNLTRTLKKMESYGLITMKTGKHGSKQPQVPYSEIVLDMSIGSNAQRA